MPNPSGYHTLTPRLFVKDPAAEIAFLKRVFGASGELQANVPSEIRIGDSLLLLSGVEVRQPTRSVFYVYVEDVEATHQRALQAGAVSMEEPQDVPYGDRRCMIEDPSGTVWQIATMTRAR
ncbi:MAG: VOC family protein [bacterium]